MIAAVVLAAGASTRMGSPKALLPARDGRRFVDTIVATAKEAGADHVVCVVAPPHGEEVARALADVTVTWNQAPELGMLSSVQAGVAALPKQARAALVWPVDTPFVAAATVRVLMMHAHNIVVPVHNNRGGHPIVIPQRFFAELLAMPSERTLRALVGAHAADVTRLVVADKNVLVDVDTPADYARTRD
jgi:CTP:molybdopterin cytidylyltransferase MocA